MNNEIGRKLTSLTLMTIMLAGGMTIAAPSMMVPEVAAAGSLYVSAENAQFDNTFGGAQIVEVIVMDSGRNATDEAVGEPTVKVDDKLLRMAQASDGNWYAYFGDDSAVMAADAADNNLDFGIDHPLLFSTDANLGAADVLVNATDGTVSNPPTLSNWNNTIPAQSADDTLDGVYGIGQLGIVDTDYQVDSTNTQEWPFIQLYEFTVGDDFKIVYEQAGTDEIV